MTDDRNEQPDILKGHCPSCGPNINADIKGEHISSFNDGHFWGRTSHRILVCRGCDIAYFQTEEVFSEDVEWEYDDDGRSVSSVPSKLVYYPSPIKRERPKWADNFMAERLLAELGIIEKGDLWSLFDDVYGCLNADLPIPAAIAIRTTFDKATEYLGINPTISFAKKLTALFDLGKISEDERDVLIVLVDAGSAAAHRGWKPKPKELDTLVSLIETFLHRTFVLGEAARQVKASVPRKPKP
jgi:hypothetical protein